MKPRVLVAAPLVGDAVERLRAIAEVEQAPHVLGRAELLARIEGVAGLVALLVHRVDGQLLARAPSLRVVGNHAVGVDNVDLAACAARGVVVTNTPGVLTEATADLAFALLLDAARRVTEGDRLVRSGAWKGWEPTAHLGRRVHGATLGIVGFGRIGRAVAARARGFSLRVLYASRSAAPPDVEAALGATRVSLDTLLAEADFVSLHAPLDASTRGLLGAPRARPDAARGGAGEHGRAALSSTRTPWSRPSARATSWQGSTCIAKNPPCPRRCARCPTWSSRRTSAARMSPPAPRWPPSPARVWPRCSRVARRLTRSSWRVWQGRYSAALRCGVTTLPAERLPNTSVGERPGASALGVTSDEGNICTNPGAWGTRSTTRRSRVIEVY